MDTLIYFLKEMGRSSKIADHGIRFRQLRKAYTADYPELISTELINISFL
jgi:hypothetical protein